MSCGRKAENYGDFLCRVEEAAYFSFLKWREKMKIGAKIRMLRELKKVSPKAMADALDMSLSGYSKIERDEVELSIDKLTKMSEVLGMKPEEVLAFDEKVVFNIFGDNNMGNNHPTINNFPEKLITLYEDKIKLLENMLEMKQAEIDRLRG